METYADLERDNYPYISPLSYTDYYNALKMKWMAKISGNQNHLSKFMRNLLARETTFEDFLLKKKSIPVDILEKLKNKPKKSFDFSSIILFNTSPAENYNSNILLVNDSPLEVLKRKGFFSLIKRLEILPEELRNEILLIHDPIIMEQVVEIYYSCVSQHHDALPEAPKLFVDFAIHLALFKNLFGMVSTCGNSNQAEELHSSLLSLREVKEILGSLVFLINYNPLLAFKCISIQNYRDALQNIKNEFGKYIQAICLRLEKNYQDHNETGLQPADVALHTQIPIEIARVLLTNTGAINVGIISILSDIFLSRGKWHINHEANLEYALRILHHSPQLRDKFKTIRQPHSLFTPLEDVVRITLDLPPSMAIGDHEFRLAALTALLSHLRQGEDLSCFAVSLAIEVLSDRLDRCIADLHQLLREGKLTRLVDGILKNIPFVMKIRDDQLNKQIFFNAKGYLLDGDQKKGPLWHAPGIRAACQSIGISSYKEAIQTVIKYLPSPLKKSMYQMRIKKILQYLCLFVQKEKPSANKSFQDLFSKVFFAFSSQTAQPLLKIWENSIASMAETDEKGMLRMAISESLLDTLQFKLGEQNIPSSPLLIHFFLKIQKFINQNIQLRYDPDIRRQLLSESLNKEAGFVMYHFQSRIDNPNEFQKLVLTLLKNVKVQCIQKKTEEEKIELERILNLLIPYIETSQFIRHLLVRYNPINLKAMGKESDCNWKLLQFTPWVTKIGNNSKSVLKIYYELEQPIQMTSFTFKDGKEALEKIIEICVQMPDKEKELLLNNPYKLKPLNIFGKHRLSFMPGHHSLVPAWKNECSIKEWIEKVVIQPGTAISQTEITKKTKRKFIKLLEDKIFPRFVSPIQAKSLSIQLKEIEKKMTISEYRSTISTLCHKEIIVPASFEQFLYEIDTILCNSLDPLLLSTLKKSAVRFADTNWCKGIHDIHFCFLINPGTGELELWEVYADGSHLKALDQNYWLCNQKWEFLTFNDES